jgi:hypothetical protein
VVVCSALVAYAVGAKLEGTKTVGAKLEGTKTVGAKLEGTKRGTLQARPVPRPVHGRCMHRPQPRH